MVVNKRTIHTQTIWKVVANKPTSSSSRRLLMTDSTCKITTALKRQQLSTNKSSQQFKMMGFQWTSFTAKLQSHIKHLNPSLKTMDSVIKTISKAILNLSSSSSNSNSSMIRDMITANRIINMTITKIPLNRTTITIKDMIKAATTRATMIINSKPINQSTVSKPTPKNKKTKIGTTQQVALLRNRHLQPNSSHSMQTCRLRIVLTKIIYSRCANANNRQQLNLCLTHIPPKVNLSHLLLINSHTSSHSKHTNSRNSSPKQTTSWQK